MVGVNVFSGLIEVEGDGVEVGDAILISGEHPTRNINIQPKKTNLVSKRRRETRFIERKLLPSL
jgi:hypothetical protein